MYQRNIKIVSTKETNYITTTALQVVNSRDEEGGKVSTSAKCIVF